MFVFITTEDCIGATDRLPIKAGTEVIGNPADPSSVVVNKPQNYQLFKKKGYAWTDIARQLVWFPESEYQKLLNSMSGVSSTAIQFNTTVSNNFGDEVVQAPYPVFTPMPDKSQAKSMRKKFILSVLMYIFNVCFVLFVFALVNNLFPELLSDVLSERKPEDVPTTIGIMGSVSKLWLDIHTMCSESFESMLLCLFTVTSLSVINFCAFFISKIIKIVQWLNMIARMRMVSQWFFPALKVKECVLLTGGKKDSDLELMKNLQSAVINTVLSRSNLPQIILQRISDPQSITYPQSITDPQSIPERWYKSLSDLQTITVFKITTRKPYIYSYVIVINLTPVKFASPSAETGLSTLELPSSTTDDAVCVANEIIKLLPAEHGRTKVKYYFTIASSTGWAEGTKGVEDLNQWYVFYEYDSKAAAAGKRFVWKEIAPPDQLGNEVVHQFHLRLRPYSIKDEIEAVRRFIDRESIRSGHGNIRVSDAARELDLDTEDVSNHFDYLAETGKYQTYKVFVYRSETFFTWLADILGYPLFSSGAVKAIRKVR